MFSFHKPKIYRSNSGCCICKAKSSSSRFTDSKKYENEFERCFRTSEKRTGEICNACVLLVKRWKKLPPGTQRDWRHVVDARAGPGTKSLKTTNGKPHSNSNSSSASSMSFTSSSLKRPSKPKKVHSSSEDMLLAVEDSLSEHSPSMSRIPSPEPCDSSDLEEEDDYLSEGGFNDNETEDIATTTVSIGKRKLRSRSSSSKSGSSKKCNTGGLGSSCGKRTAAKMAIKIVKNTSIISSFLDMSFWRKETICCGVIFTGPDNEVVIYPKLLKPCSCRRNSGVSLDCSKGSLSGLSDNISLTSSPLEDDANSNASSYNSVI